MSRIKVVFFDVDGVLVRGAKALPGASKAIRDVRASGRRVYLLSNNASRSRSSLARSLRLAGLPVVSDDIITSASLTAQFLKGPSKPIFVAGAQGIVDELRASGYRGDISRNPSKKFKAGIVIVGLNKEFSYEILAAAQRHLMAGAKFIATNLDPTLPVEKGFLPGAGSLVAAIATACGRQPDVVIGKPSPVGMRLVLRQARVKASDAILVGDRLDTDIEAASRVGMRSVLVLSGHASRKQVRDAKNKHHKPGAIIRNVSSLCGLLDS